MLALRSGLWLAVAIAIESAAQSIPPGSTTTWTVSPAGMESSRAMVPRLLSSTSGSTEKVYPDTSLTTCPEGETLLYFIYGGLPLAYRGSDWCGAAAGDIAWANDNDPVRWRIPYLLESCQPGVSWTYSHAFQNGTRYYSPPYRGINMVCSTAPPPEDTPLGCATGAGGFRSCPGNSAPSGTVEGPKQNFGPPDAPSDSTGPTEKIDPPGNPPQAALRGNTCSKSAAAVGDPVHAGTGNVYHEEIDFRGRGPSLLRAYNSGSQTWSHNHQVRVIASSSKADVVRPDGRIQTFVGSADGLWSSNGTVSSKLERLPAGLAARWRHTNDHDDVELYDAAGMPVSISARNGQTLTYQTSGQLVLAVTNSFGRRLSFSYDSQGRVTGATLPDGQQVGYGYDGLGRLAQVTYADGASRQYLYESAAQPLLLTGVIDEAGVRFASWSYDAQGRAVSASQAGGANAAQLTYQGSSTIVSDALGGTRTMSFANAGGKIMFAGQSAPCADCIGDAAAKSIDPGTGLLFQSQDMLGINTMFTWDPARKLPLSTTLAAGRPEAQSVQTEWHPVFRLPVQVTEAGRVTRHTYDSGGNRLNTTVTDTATGAKRTESWTYTALGQVQSHTDARGHTWQYGLDSAGNRVSMTDPLGRVTAYQYDAAGRLVQTTHPDAMVVRYAYDPRGRLIESSQAQEVTRYSYTATGLLAKVSLPNGVEVSYSYDAAQRLVAAADNRGAAIRYTLDGMGNRVREVLGDSGGNIAIVTSRTVNTFNRVIDIQDAYGRSTQMAYDLNGEFVGKTDALGQSTLRSLDGLRRPVATTFADSSSSRQLWGALDELTEVVDPKGVKTRHTYNAFGEVLSETSPDIGTIRYTRDENGAVFRMEDAKGQITRVERDPLGRPLAISYADGQVARFGYDTAGRLAWVDDRSGSSRFERDMLGRVSVKSQTVLDNPSAATTLHVAYGYQHGDLAALTYPSGMRVSYSRHLGRITGIQVQLPSRAEQPFVSSLVYTAWGQPRSWAWSNGDVTHRTFDANGRMTANEFARYIHDAAGRITGIEQRLWVRSGSGRHETFETTPLAWSVAYDNRNRITSFSRAGSHVQYSYDPNGNRLKAIDIITSDSDLDGLLEEQDLTRTTQQSLAIEPASNRLVGLSQTMTRTRNGKQQSSAGTDVAYRLDANGALTGDGLREFEYDAANRLEKVKAFRYDEEGQVHYLHNALGQRVFKSERQAERSLPDEQQLGQGFIAWLKQRFASLFTPAAHVSSLGSVYVYGDGEIPNWALLAEYDNGTAAGKGRTEYIWLPLEDGSASPVGFVRSGQLYAVHTDHLGTPRLVTDGEKRPVWQWPYSAFGDNAPTGPLRRTHNAKKSIAHEPQMLRATEPIDFGLRYPGQMDDPDAGSYYNYFREYRAGLGRYTQADPLGVAGGYNRFAYVEGDPLLRVDPTGEAGMLVPALGVGVTVYGLSKMFSNQNSCEEMCDLTFGDEVKACGDPERQDILDARKNQRVLGCKASCAMGSVMSRLLPGKLK